MHTFLRDHFQEFDDELDILLSRQSDDHVFDKQIYDELRENHKIIKGFSKAILDTLKTYRNGEILEAHRIFEDKIDEMQDHIAFLDLKGYRLFRIRSDNKNPRYKRKELFHVPFEKATLIRAGRYSIPGFPCLYLGGSGYSDTGLSLCWFECNLPDKFYWSEFEITNAIPSMLVIDFVWSPFSSAIKAAHYRTQAHKKTPSVNSDLISFVITYPLMAACSLITADKGDNHFIPEYVISQMLLLWVRNNKKGCGVAYLSSSEFDKARDHTAFNVAIPARRVNKKGHCRKLKQEFRLSDPRFVDVTNDIFKPSDKKFMDIRNYIHEKHKMLGFEPMREMVSVCDSYLLLHSKVISEKYQDMSLIYDYINDLNLFAEQLLKFKKYYCSASMKQIEKDGFGKDKECANSSYNDAWEKFIEFREILRSYWYFIDTQLKTPQKPVFKFIDES